MLSERARYKKYPMPRRRVYTFKCGYKVTRTEENRFTLFADDEERYSIRIALNKKAIANFRAIADDLEQMMRRYGLENE